MIFPTIVYNVNQNTLKASDTVISAASCTTNCLAPMAKVSTISPCTERYNDNGSRHRRPDASFDGPHIKGDLRRSRAAAINIVPNSTGAAKAIGLVIPELNGKLIGSAQRVPTPTGSTTILVAVVKWQGHNRRRYQCRYEGSSYRIFLNTNEDQIVSSDIIGSTAGSIFDATQTMVAKIDDDTYQVQVVSGMITKNSYTSQMVRTINISQ